MIELLTTPKNAIIFAIVITLFLTISLTCFLTISGLPLISAFAFCLPLSLITTVLIMIFGAIMFHAHKIINK